MKAEAQADLNRNSYIEKKELLTSKDKEL